MAAPHEPWPCRIGSRKPTGSTGTPIKILAQPAAREFPVASGANEIARLDELGDQAMSSRSPLSLESTAPWWKAARGERLMIGGGRKLHGEIAISGAKNAALPLMILPLLTSHLVTLHNVPRNLDVAVLATLLRQLGVTIRWATRGAALSLHASAERVDPGAIDAALVGRMRASFLLLGALLARCGKASIPLPGGDAIGLRGVDYHLDGLRAMG